MGEGLCDHPGWNTYRTALAQIAGVTRLTELDGDGFEAMMGIFEYLGFRPLVSQGSSYGARPGMASFAQIELIRALWREYTHGSYDGEAELNRWLERCFKISSLRFLTAAAAPKAITALKAMKARSRAA
ncbi:MAG: regulatory protein GemA [Paracoccus sp. (in: a-proteobacteria)]|uniref:regulatory protein GemA n=1 Tax=Paracoccus sp. TaxID=267 RepID=UPI0040598266